jgi:hypothetical protein
MKETTMIDAKNIKLEYADKVAPNVNRGQSMINNINHWLGDSADSINSQAGTIVVYFQNNREQRVSFEGMAEDLQAILYKKLALFQPQHTQQSDNPGM